MASRPTRSSARVAANAAAPLAVASKRAQPESKPRSAAASRKKAGSASAQREEDQQPIAGAATSTEPDVPVATVETPVERQLREQTAAVAELALLVRNQHQQLQHLQSSPAASPRAAAQQSPQHSPAQQTRSIAPAAAAAAAAVAPPAPIASRKKEPRLSDLTDYDGAAGEKLDEWLDSLQRCADYYEQSGVEAVRFAVAHLRDTAYSWWRTLDSSAQAGLHSGGVDAFALALRGRFQPVTTERVARGQLDKLQQGARHINEYIADFSKLRARIPSMSEADSLYAFERGLRSDIAIELRKQRVATLRDATELAAHIGGVAAGASQGKPSLNQMDIDDGNGASLEDRISKAVLNAMHARDSSGMGTKTQPHRGYTQERERGGSGRGGGRGGLGRGGRFGQRGPPVVPGVPENVVRQRLDAQQCIRCGGDGHRSFACPNAITASGN